MARAARKEATHAYVGVCQCGGWRALSVDEGRKSDLSYCAGSDRIERVPLEQARAWPACKCPKEASRG